MGPLRDRSHISSAGFSLIELMVAIVVAGILLAIATPHFATTLRVWQLRAAARQIYSELQNARFAAVQENSRWQFSAAGNRTYRVLADRNHDRAFADPAEVVLSRTIGAEHVTQ